MTTTTIAEDWAVGECFTLLFGTHPIRIMHISSKKTGHAQVVTHAADLAVLFERKSNVSRLLGKYRGSEKIRLRFIGAHNHIIGQDSNALTLKGVQRLLACCSKLDAMHEYKTWIQRKLVRVMSVGVPQPITMAGYSEDGASTVPQSPIPESEPEQEQETESELPPPLTTTTNIPILELPLEKAVDSMSQSQSLHQLYPMLASCVSDLELGIMDHQPTHQVDVRLYLAPQPWCSGLKTNAAQFLRREEEHQEETILAQYLACFYQAYQSCAASCAAQQQRQYPPPQQFVPQCLFAH